MLPAKHTQLFFIALAKEVRYKKHHTAFVDNASQVFDTGRNAGLCLSWLKIQEFPYKS